MPNSLGGHAISSQVPSGTSVATSAFATQPTAGSTVVVGVFWGIDTATPNTPTVTDNAGNTYTPIGSNVGDDNRRGRLFEAHNIQTAASFVVTATFGANAIDLMVGAGEIKGAHLTAPIDLVGGQQQASAGPTTDAITTGNLGTPSEAGEFVFGIASGQTWPDNMAAGTGFTQLDDSSGNNRTVSEYLIQGAAAAVACTWTWDTTHSVVSLGVTVKPAAAGGGGGSIVPILNTYRRRWAS